LHGEFIAGNGKYKKFRASPFMLAQGQTYDLPWMQVMNMHNAFLFTANAF
jgi:hypothetical protein